MRQPTDQWFQIGDQMELDYPAASRLEPEEEAPPSRSPRLLLAVVGGAVAAIGLVAVAVHFGHGAPLPPAAIAAAPPIAVPPIAAPAAPPIAAPAAPPIAVPPIAAPAAPIAAPPIAAPIAVKKPRPAKHHTKTKR
jgi:hypothetical protein